MKEKKKGFSENSAQDEQVAMQMQFSLESKTLANTEKRELQKEDGQRK